MEKKKIQEAVVLTDERTFGKEKYAWFIFEDGTDVLMFYDDAIKFLQKYSVLNRFKTADSLFSSFKTKFTTERELLNTDGRFYDKGRYMISDVVRKAEDASSELEAKLGIEMNNLTSKDMYEKIKQIILEECQRSGISYEKDHKKIIEGVLEKLKQTEYPAPIAEYPTSLEELKSIYQRKIAQAKSSTAPSYGYENVERDFADLRLSMVTYTGDMFSSSYQLINALVDRKKFKRKEILGSWAEFMLVLPEYMNLIKRVNQYSLQAANEKILASIKMFYSNQEFMQDLELLMDHASEKEIYRYHATDSLKTGLSILENGLFLSSCDPSSTSYAEFSVDDVLTYRYGGTFMSVGDCIVVFKEPVGENIVRATTEEEKQNNLIASRRMCISWPINDYVIDKKYMVGLIDRVNQKVYRANQDVISLASQSDEDPTFGAPKAL